MCQVVSFTNYKAHGAVIDDRFVYHCANGECHAVAYHGEPVECPECGCNLVVETFVTDEGVSESYKVV
ncbi:hypothetical protein NIGALANA_273 [Bacillus phage Nigalana]|uniref:hypothetical protein n=1 Tax=Bacillus phage Nigalana TaxID=1805951 RepID=UPI0007A7732E|nr:hypothetical protein BI005_gp273 [Bacillus phage Nigalana]AMW61419.1 hypothetical protein NIGALANA_273 [Bacillus phage Nigalana]